MERINCYLAESQIAYLRAVSKSKGYTVSEIIRRAIDDYLEQQIKKQGLTELQNEKN